MQEDQHHLLQVAAATVGTSYFLNSLDVTDAPERINQPIPVPSVYRDDRGEIHNFQIGPRRINLLHTVKGVMRSGDLHPQTQHDFVFSGQVEVWTLQKDGTTRKDVYGPNQYIAIPPYVPHIFHFLEDSVIAEWWDNNSFFAWFYRPYRTIVDSSFQSTTGGGQFSHYSIASKKTLLSASTTTNVAVLCSGALLCFIAGYTLGSKRR
jgi:hypothetical protein